MVGVAAESVPVSGFDHGPGDIVHHLLGAAPGARHFTHGLLRKDGKKAAFAQVAECVEVPGRGDAQPVSESEGFTQTHEYRRSPWEHFPKDVGIVGIERAV